MVNFDYMTPTRLIFGKDSIEKLPEVMNQFGPKILLTYGGGSIKKIGLYDKVKELLAGREIVELSGIQPVKILDFMHEISWGSTDENPIYRGGHPWDTVDAMARQNQDLTDRGWRENPYFKTNMATLENDRIAPKTDEWLSSLGYEREGFYYRCRRKDDSQHTVVLFCHGGSSTAMLAQILNLPFPYLCAAVHMNHTALTIIRLDARPGSLSAPVLELVSDDRHIRGITV